MGIDVDMVGRELVRGPEGELDLAGTAGQEMGQEGEGVLELLADCDLRRFIHQSVVRALHRHRHRGDGVHHDHLFLGDPGVLAEHDRPCRHPGRALCGPITGNDRFFEHLVVFLQHDNHPGDCQDPLGHITDAGYFDQGFTGFLQRKDSVRIGRGPAVRSDIGDIGPDNGRSRLVHDHSRRLPVLGKRGDEVDPVFRGAGIDVFSGHAAADRINTHVRDGELLAGQDLPAVRRDRVDALVVDRHEGFRSGIRFQADGILGSREGLVRQGDEGQRKHEGVVPTAELAVEGDRPSILEIEDLEPHGVGVGSLVLEGKVRQGTLLPLDAVEMDPTGLKHFAVLSEDGHDGPFLPVRGAHPEANLLSVRDLGRSGDEQFPERGRQDGLALPDLEDPVTLLVFDFLSGTVLRPGADLEGIQTGRPSGQVEAQFFPGSGFP